MEVIVNVITQKVFSSLPLQDKHIEVFNDGQIIRQKFSKIVFVKILSHFYLINATVICDLIRAID